MRTPFKADSSRLLFAVPDAVFIPGSPHPEERFVGNQNGGDYEFLAYLISDLYHAGIDVHIVQPHFRRIMTAGAAHCSGGICADLPASRVHLAQDRIFFYADEPDANPEWMNLRIAVAFQREVLHRWIPEIAPDLLQCQDWMCGLLPAAAGALNLPAVFTVGRIQSQWAPLWLVEDMGLDAAPFWDRLYYHSMPGDYTQTRRINCADLLLSGINAAVITNTMGIRALQELAISMGGDTSTALRRLLRAKIGTRQLTCIFEKVFSTDDYIALYEQILGHSLTAGEAREADARTAFDSQGRSRIPSAVESVWVRPVMKRGPLPGATLFDFRPPVFAAAGAGRL